MKLQELREKKSDDLEARLREIREAIFRAGCKAEARNPKAGSEIGPLRKEAARIRTLLRQRELASAAPGEIEAVGKAIAAEAGRDGGADGRNRLRRLRREKAALGRRARELELAKKGQA